MNIKKAIEMLTELDKKGETEIYGIWYCREYVQSTLNTIISKGQWSDIVGRLDSADDRPGVDNFVEDTVSSILGIEGVKALNGQREKRQTKRGQIMKTFLISRYDVINDCYQGQFVYIGRNVKQARKFIQKECELRDDAYNFDDWRVALMKSNLADIMKQKERVDREITFHSVWGDGSHIVSNVVEYDAETGGGSSRCDTA